MDPRDKLNAIQQQKRKLQARIQQINTTDTANMDNDPELDRLLQKKRAMDEERVKQAQYRKLEKEYKERKKQMEREKQLERIKNEKRVLELEIAMKKVVVDGIKQKVRGMNSEQLMKHDYFTTVDPEGKTKNSNFKDAFESYLLNEGPEKLAPKYDIKKLNEARLEIFEKKEESVMRQLLLKEITASPEPIQLDVMALSREQLIEELQARDIDFEEFLHVVAKEEIVQKYPLIEKSIKQRIVDKRQDIEDEKSKDLAVERQKKALREQVSELPYKDVEVVKRLLYDLFDQICVEYQKRHVLLSSDDKQQRVKNLQKQYEQILNNKLVEELSHQILEQMLENMRKEMMKQASQEITKLHDYAHQKTQECFKEALGQGNIYSKIQQLDHYKVPLLFVNEQENEVGRPKPEQYLKNLDNDYNVYETQGNTTNLVNDIALLDLEERYFGKINTQIKSQTEFKTEEIVFYYDRQLFAISKSFIKSVKKNRTYHSLNLQGENIEGVYKIHNNWLIYTEIEILLVASWGREEFGNQLGGRISNPCGIISFGTFYPVCTLLGHPTSALLGFEKGQILKFNFNKNRVKEVQTNITHYLPVIQHSKSGDDPAFPLDNRNYLSIQQEKPKPTDEIHEYRQFFEHHSEPIIFLGFYRIDRMISIDRSLKCALWDYNRTRGAATYEPVFKFQIKSSYQIYTEDENPRYKDIYPLVTSTETPEEMYQKYMLTQSLLKLQLYNNPKKQIAYFKAPHWDKEDEDKPIWKVTYKEHKGQVNKIFESYYNVSDGKISAQQAQLQTDNIYILCEREHIIRKDLKTIKLYSWNLFDRKLGKVGLQIDMFKDQKVSNFLLLPNQFRGTDLELALISNSGRLLLFSLLTGQLLKNINEEINTNNIQTQLYFKSLIKAQDSGNIYGISNSGVVELNWQDNNTINDRGKLNKAIDTAKRKYFR